LRVSGKYKYCFNKQLAKKFFRIKKKKKRKKLKFDLVGRL
jgi:hypothetical protein